MTDLVTFLRARLDEDDREANAVLWPESGNRLNWTLLASATVDIGTTDFCTDDRTVANHIVRHDPVRVLDEVDAKRGILDAHARYPQPQSMAAGMIWACGTCGSVDDSPVEWPCNTLRLLARMYMRHPDYRHEWLPSA